MKELFFLFLWSDFVLASHTSATLLTSTIGLLLMEDTPRVKQWKEWVANNVKNGVLTQKDVDWIASEPSAWIDYYPVGSNLPCRDKYHYALAQLLIFLAHRGRSWINRCWYCI